MVPKHLLHLHIRTSPKLEVGRHNQQMEYQRYPINNTIRIEASPKTSRAQQQKTPDNNLCHNHKRRRSSSNPPQTNITRS